MTGPAITLSAAVMTHPSRLAAARAMCHRYPELDLAVVVDPDPGQPPSPARTARLAWGAAGRHATHHLVVQDDVLLSASFRSSVLAAAAARPDNPICLFTEWCSATAFAGRLLAWFGYRLVEACDEYTPTLALVLPVALAEAVRATTDAQPADDVVVLGVLRRERVPAFVTVPTLADHGTLPSLTGNDSMGQRRSVCFLGSDPPPAHWRTADRAPQMVPCFSRSYPRPFYLMRPRRPGQRWTPLQPERVLRARGIAPERLGAGLAARIAPLAGCYPRLRRDVLAGLWLTGVMHGIEVVTMASDRGVSVDGVLREPLGWQALDTMGAGVLDRFLAGDRLADAAAPLRAFVRQAFTEGVERGAAAGTGRGPALPQRS